MQQVAFTGRLRGKAGRARSAMARFYTALSRCGSRRQARQPVPQADPAAREAAQRDRQGRYDGFVLSF